MNNTDLIAQLTKGELEELDKDALVIAIRERAARLKNGSLTEEDRAFYQLMAEKSEKEKAEAEAQGAAFIMEEDCYGEGN